MGLLHTDMTLCKGVGCAIKESCDRYLAGNKFKDDDNPHWWMDSCGEDRNGYLTKNNLQESFNEVINQAEARGHLNIDDVRKLANSGIPLLDFCTDRSVFFDAIRYRFEKWLNSL